MEANLVYSGKNNQYNMHNLARQSSQQRHHHRHRGEGRAYNSEEQYLRERRSDRDTDVDTDRDDGHVSYVNMPSRLDSQRAWGHRSSQSTRYTLPPYDDNETTTVVTGGTSETGYSDHDLRNERAINHKTNFASRLCSRYAGAAVACFVSLIAFLSPIIMLVLPKIGLSGWYLEGTTAESEGVLIAMSFKFLILLIGAWALFLRKPKSTLPRIFVSRAVIVAITSVVTLVYWLFYGVRIYNKECGWSPTTIAPVEDMEVDDSLHSYMAQCYSGVVGYAASLVDVLLFVHYLAVILIELKHVQPKFVVQLVRSPDGEIHSYTVGQLSIQRLAVWCLEQYYKDFQVYNPSLENIPRRRSSAHMTELKVYDVDGVDLVGGGSQDEGRERGSDYVNSAPSSAAGQIRSNLSLPRRHHNERFYEELELEQRIRRRRARLVVAAEEAFAHVKRTQDDSGIISTASPTDSLSAMDAEEAAQAILPTLARPLQKYLKATQQRLQHPRDIVLEHLVTCLEHGLSHKAFLSRYFTQGSVIWNDLDYSGSDQWRLVCDRRVSRPVEDSMTFELCQGDITLLVTVRKLPHFNLVEDNPDTKNQKFVLRMNSETDV